MRYCDFYANELNNCIIIKAIELLASEIIVRHTFTFGYVKTLQNLAASKDCIKKNRIGEIFC